jgi:hypothetical protein
VAGDRQQQAELHAERAGAGAVGERRVAEALRANTTSSDPAARRREPGDPPAEREQDRPDQDQERDREPEGDFGDSWHSYRERAERIRQTYGWTVPEPPSRAEPWLPVGCSDDQEYNQPPDRPHRWLGEGRDDDREDR